jgi:hypothetical protein
MSTAIAVALIVAGVLRAQSGPSAEQRLSALEVRMAQLEGRIAALEAARPATATNTEASAVKPSDDQIVAAVTVALKGDVPPVWSGSLMGGVNVAVDTVTVMQMGIYNDAARYWPVTVHVYGSCNPKNLMGADPNRRVFSGNARYQVSRDDYGNWVAELAQE